MPFGITKNRIPMLPGQPAPEPIRLQTLVMLRWIAVFGQLSAVAVAYLFDVSLPLTTVLLVIGLAVGLNLWLSLRPVPRISDRAAALQLGFDLWQIAMLLTLTGGMTNPFALLVLAPVTIAATSLPTRHLVALGTATLVMVTIGSLLAEPLSFNSGAQLALDQLYQLGHWTAIVIGVVFLSGYAHRVATDLLSTSDALFAARMALERELKLQHLGGVVAAAAHEMGTPLATIKLVSAELTDELSEALPDRSDLAEDLLILRQSADRCGAILRSMGRAGKDDLLIKNTPLENLLDEAAAPHKDRGIEIEITVEGDGDQIHRDAAITHGLRNLIQNGVDFARHKVQVHAVWTAQDLKVIIRDDGPGYLIALLPRLGTPFLTTRPGSDGGHSYEGMGLGLFIAKALLERTGARVFFENSDYGAVATVTWQRHLIEVDSRKALGENPEIKD